MQLEFHELTHIVDKSTRVGHDANLDMFFNSWLHQCSAVVLALLSTSDYFLMFVKVDTNPKTCSDVQFHRTIYQCKIVDWYSLKSYIAESPYQHFLQLDVTGWSPQFRTDGYQNEMIYHSQTLPVKAKQPAMVHA